MINVDSCDDCSYQPFCHQGEAYEYGSQECLEIHRCCNSKIRFELDKAVERALDSIELYPSEQAKLEKAIRGE